MADKSILIYEPSDVIEDKGLLTLLCLLHDEIIFFGLNSLSEEKKILINKISENSTEKIEKRLDYFQNIFEPLRKEGVLTYYGPNEVENRFPESSKQEIGLNIDKNNVIKDGLLFKVEGEPNRLTSLIISTMLYDSKRRSVKTRDLIRWLNLFSVAEAYKLPITSNKLILDKSYLPIGSNVPFLSSQLEVLTLKNLAMPNLEAYSPDDIILARKELSDELKEFKIGILDLTWTLRQNTRDTSDIMAITNECESLIKTKIKASLLNLEHKIKKHNNSRVRKLLSAGKIMLEVGKTFISPDPSNMLLAGGKALMTTTEEINKKVEAESQISSYVYHLKKRNTVT